MKIEELKNEAELIADSHIAEHRAMAKITLAALEHYEAMKPDENGLLPCPFCGGVVTGMTDYSFMPGGHEILVCVGCGLKVRNTRKNPVLDAVREVLEGKGDE
jgi:hypothetical protein